MLVLDKTDDHAHGRFLVSGISPDNVPSPTWIHGQHLVDLTSKNRGFDIQHIQIIFVHFIVGVFRQRLSMVEDRVANPFQFATGHNNSLSEQKVPDTNGTAGWQD